MANLFKNQALIEIKLDTGIAIPGGYTAKILYKKPNGATGSWDAIVTESTKVKYVTDNDSLDQVGNWAFQSYLKETSSGKHTYGQIIEYQIKPPLTIPD